MTTQLPMIGIDFGTSKSCMAWFNPKTQQAEVLMNAQGELKTPSVVYFGDGDEVLVGSPAEAMLEDEIDRWRVVRSVKRELVSAPTLMLPGHKRVKPVDVAAEVLRKLRRDAEEGHFHQPVLRAVITCPAEFGALERDAIAKAGKLAGFEEVKLLEEPVAAGLAYQRAGLAVGDHVLVYDLGGGTFDLAVLMRDAEQGYRLALEPQGETRCGGDDFDRALYDHLDEVAEETLGRPIAPDGKLDPGFLQECREAKEALTAQERTRLNAYLPGEPNPVIFKQVLERAVFEELVRERVEMTVRLTEALLEQARASGCAVDTVVLIGGSARVPLVIKQLQAALPVAPQRWEKQDVAVALGAAYHASRLWGNDAIDLAKAPVVRKRQPTLEVGKQAPATEPTGGQALPATAKTQTAAPTAVTVALDGSGDATSLEEAMAKVASGGMIRLMPGEHRLAKALVVEKTVQLVGVGMDATTVVGYWEPQVVKVTAGGSLQADGITFSHSGATPANVVVVEDGRLELTGCRITGGVEDPNGEIGDGHGLVIAGAATGKVIRCCVEGNAGGGIYVRDRAQPTLEGNTCQGNKRGGGIVYTDTAAGVARQNQCVGNEVSGIAVGDQAQPILEGNTCQGNKAAGIFYVATAAGVARQNQCVGNEMGGIMIVDQGKPTLEGNICESNKYGGIVYTDAAAGVARQNQCMGNALSGIEVKEQAQPTLEDNTCKDNKQNGIVCSDASASAVRKNQCVGNEWSGIQVAGQAQPTLEENTCQGNKRSGILYSSSAAGAVRQNYCVSNDWSGIQVGEETKVIEALSGTSALDILQEMQGAQFTQQVPPILEYNRCKENKQSGIAYFGAAAGTARQNECASNLTGILVRGQAQPTLEDNTCQGNRNGILIGNNAQPDLKRNNCRENRLNGMVYFDQAGGSAQENMCLQNGKGDWFDTMGEGKHGIRVEGIAQPLLDRNVCTKNQGAGIYIGSAAKPRLESNQCSGNRKKDLDDRR